jgi:hypothetical protein
VMCHGEHGDCDGGTEGNADELGHVHLGEVCALPVTTRPAAGHHITRPSGGH